jgi:hypothetical protein
MDWLNPVEWAAWVYGKLFQQHVVLGGILVVGVCAAIGLMVWIRGVDKFKEDHPNHTVPSGAGDSPKEQTVTANNTASLGVTVQYGNGVHGATPHKKSASVKSHVVIQHGALCPPPDIEDRRNHIGSTGGGTVVGLDNAGQVGTAYIGDVTAQAGQGSSTTVVKNEKSGKIDTYIMQDSQLGNESWWLYLGDRIDDNPAATKEQVADILTDATNQLKKHWSRLSLEAKAANLREWSDKQTRILSLVGTNQELFDEMHICPSFIKLATPSIPKRQP